VLLLVFQLTASIQYAALATVLVMGIFAFGNVPGLQVYVVQKRSSIRQARSTLPPA
jgi:predicted MFS family arabinose efflux permease